ncbi:FAD-dependent oxidoreductase [Ruicaihuangia caeni]|uniref:FAD-dependent oxidoreductase n=1 Tax=Ruicaihuangia caeni TaxID=3042517 RepID=A0AAW6T7E7_9MICO|nr:FAD-dependent oxidoreductase [Klugiella sp. YN-L-19]MDI2099144.1 FAD-dependent oxidoreductase [Klugiella sp. YN-L-19]
MEALTARERELIETPLRLGPVEVKNRVFVAPHTTNFGVAGENLVTARHLDYHGARARGGAGLIITEGIRVHPTSLRKLGIHAYSDEALPGLTALAETVHNGGARLFGQLLHTGRHSGDELAGSWGPEPTPWTLGAPVPHVMNEFDIDAVIAGFAAAADRLIRAGFDGMEVHLGHGHLLHQFLSPITNHRTDGYGGSLAARVRLAREVIAAVRETVAGRAALGVRLSADEFMDGGLHPDEMVDIVRALQGDGPFDFLHVSHAAYIGTSSLATQMADMSYGVMPFIHLPERFKREFPDTPVLAICRIDTLKNGAAILEAQGADMVGFARGHIAEPRLTELSLSAGMAGAAPPRSCIACNQGCNANLEAIQPITCTVNPAVGREREWAVASAATATRKRVLVIGAGPAGIEATVAMASKGHDVQLVDERDEVGGQLLDLVRLDGRDGFQTLLAELKQSLDGSGVVPELGVTLSASDVAIRDPEAVVLATGARHERSPIALRSVTPVLDPEQALSDPTIAGRNVIVYDELGLWEASGLAMHLARRGAEVELVTPLAGFAPRVTVYSRLALGDQLVNAGVAVIVQHILEFDDGVPVVASATARTRRARTDADSIVHVRPRRSADGLIERLAAGGWGGELFVVGDAFAPRTAQEAVAEGRGVGLTLGVIEPAVATGIRMRPAYRYGRIREAV